MKEYRIFCYKDPKTLEVKYVGRTTNKNSFLFHHYKCSAKNGCGRPLCSWINEIESTPVIELLEETTDKSRKQFYIDKFSPGSTLLNIDKTKSEIYRNAGKSKKKKHDPYSMIKVLCEFYKKTKRFPLLKMGYPGWSADPEVELCNELNIPHAPAYIKIFGSYAAARDLAFNKIRKKKGLQYKKSNLEEKAGKKPCYTKDEMIKKLIEYRIENGSYPKMHSKKNCWIDESFNTGSLSYQNYAKVFGSITEARKLADQIFETYKNKLEVSNAIRRSLGESETKSL